MSRNKQKVRPIYPVQCFLAFKICHWGIIWPLPNQCIPVTLDNLVGNSFSAIRDFCDSIGVGLYPLVALMWRIVDSTFSLASCILFATAPRP